MGHSRTLDQGRVLAPDPPTRQTLRMSILARIRAWWANRNERKAEADADRRGFPTAEQLNEINAAAWLNPDQDTKRDPY